MFDLGWSELLVIGIVALIVVGPKDLPVMFRKLGEFTGKARRMAREFQSAMNDAARESGVDDVSKDLRTIANPKKFGMDALKDATGDLTAWSPDEAAPKAQGSGLSPERADAKRRIDAHYHEKAAEAAAAAEGPVPDPDAPAPPAEAKTP